MILQHSSTNKILKNEKIGSPELKTEFEKDAGGNTDQVERARYEKNNSEKPKPTPSVDFPTESIHQTSETAEHKDFNSNPNPKEFPDKTKKNNENRGNIEN